MEMTLKGGVRPGPRVLTAFLTRAAPRLPVRAGQAWLTHPSHRLKAAARLSPQLGDWQGFAAGFPSFLRQPCVGAALERVVLGLPCSQQPHRPVPGRGHGPSPESV